TSKRTCVRAPILTSFWRWETIRTVLRACCSDLEIALQTCLTHRVEFAVLGRLEVRIDGEGTPLGGPKQRALLAVLLLSANEVVSRDHLVDGLWGARAPASAQRSLDTYVWRLRALLGSDRIERRPPGYLLRVAPGELDLERFEHLLTQGREAAAAGDATGASGRLQEALDLWRGPALADLLNEPFAAGGAGGPQGGPRRAPGEGTRCDPEARARPSRPPPPKAARPRPTHPPRAPRPLR